MNWISKIFENKLSARIVVLIFAASGIILFANEAILDRLYLSKIKLEYGKYVGPIFLFTFLYSVLQLFIFIYKKIARVNLIRNHKRDLIISLKELDHNEIGVLREFFILNMNSIKMPINNPIVSGLENKGIIFRNSNFSNGINFNYSINEYINKNDLVAILDIDDFEKKSEEQIEIIKNERPSWLVQINTNNRYY